MNWGILGRLAGLVPVGAKTTIYVHVQFGPHGPLTGMSSARYLIFSRESFEVTVSGGSTFARVKLKEIDGMAPQDVERAV